MENEEKKPLRNEEEFFKALSEITPCDLRDSKTTIKAALVFCTQVLSYFERATFRPDQDKLELSLYHMGACEYKKAAEHLLPIKNAYIEDILKAKNNVQFPLVVFSQILNTEPDSYEYGWAKAKGGWISNWLNAQKEQTFEQ